MPTDAVVDASIIVALVTPEEHSEWASAEITSFDYFHIPDLCYYEVANAIKTKTIKKELNNRMAIDAFTEAVKLLNLCAIHGFSEIIADAIALSIKTDISTYDATYISLAKSTGSKLITLDKKLARKLENTQYTKMITAPP